MKIRFTHSLLLALLGLAACSDKLPTGPDTTTSFTNRIVYTKYDWAQANTYIPSVYTTDTAGANARKLWGLGFVTGTAANKILLGVGTDENKVADLMILNNSGTTWTYIYTHDTAHILQAFPQISANGSKVILTLRDTGANYHYHLRVIDADGKNARTLSDDLAHETQPGISADGAYAAFYQVLNNDTALIVARTDGSVANRIATVADKMVDLAGEVVWHPNGNRLAYTDDGHVYVIGRDGSGRVDVGEGLNPRWSPDGTKLAFVRNVGNFMWDVMITSDLGGTVTNVTNTTAQWELYPQWSPDGKYIVCQTGTGDPENSTSSIKLIELATGAVKLLGTPGTLPFFTR